MNILAIDVGKSKCVACVFEADSGEHCFETFSTTPQELETIPGRLRPDRVVIEIGPMAGWIGETVEACGAVVHVADPSQDGWRWRQVKRKTDRMDALTLAQLSSANQLSLVHVPGRAVRQWRSLIQYRQSLVARRTAIKNSIRAIYDREGLRLSAGRKCWTKRGLESLEEASCPFEKTDATSLWRGQLAEELFQLKYVNDSILEAEQKLDALAVADARISCVRSVPGVGPRLAETVVAVLDDPHRFRTGRQVAAYAGLVPRQWQSGSMNRQGRITCQGHGVLRSLLVEVSWLGLRHNAWMREVFDRVRRGSPARRRIAIIAVARRLLIRCWAMLREGRRWCPPGSRSTVAAQGEGRCGHGSRGCAGCLP